MPSFSRSFLGVSALPEQRAYCLELFLFPLPLFLSLYRHAALVCQRLQFLHKALRITAGPEEHALVDRTLQDFAAQPLRYDPYLSELVPEEDMRALAALCAELREELYG